MLTQGTQLPQEVVKQTMQGDIEWLIQLYRNHTSIAIPRVKDGTCNFPVLYLSLVADISVDRLIEGSLHCRV